MTIAEAAEAMATGRTSSVELTTACLERIEKRNPRLNAFITVTAEEALERAAAMDREISAGPNPQSAARHSDRAQRQLMTAGVRTTSGSESSPTSSRSAMPRWPAA